MNEAGGEDFIVFWRWEPEKKQLEFHSPSLWSSKRTPVVPEAHGKQVWLTGSVENWVRKETLWLKVSENSETDCVGAERLVDQAAEPPQFAGRRHFRAPNLVVRKGKATNAAVYGLASYGLFGPKPYEIKGLVG